MPSDSAEYDCDYCGRRHSGELPCHEEVDHWWSKCQRYKKALKEIASLPEERTCCFKDERMKPSEVLTYRCNQQREIAKQALKETEDE